VVNLVDLEENRQRYVVTNELEIGSRKQMGNVGLLCRKKIIEADHVVTFLHQAFAHVRAEEASASSYQNSLKF